MRCLISADNCWRPRSGGDWVSLDCPAGSEIQGDPEDQPMRRLSHIRPSCTDGRTLFERVFSRRWHHWRLRWHHRRARWDRNECFIVKYILKCISHTGEHDTEDDTETVTFQSKAVERETHSRFFIRRSRGQIKYDVGLLTLETPIDFSDETFSHIRSIFTGVKTTEREMVFVSDQSVWQM